MAKGRKTGGRKVGVANVRTREIADEAARDGITPLEYMIRVMRDENADGSRRDEMAKAAAPYMHPRLAAVEHSGKDGGPIPMRVESVIVDPKNPG